jgi:Carbohydrate binding module (family 6)
LRGIGLAQSTRNLQIDRYSLISKAGASIAFLDTTKKFDGWKAVYEADGAWFQYNSVQFDKKPKTVEAKVQSTKGATLEVRLDKADGPVLASIVVPKSAQWQTISAKVKKGLTGKHNLIVTQKGQGAAEVDWVTFK